MPTDRTILKNSQAGIVGSAGSLIDPLTAKTGSVAALHTKYYTAAIQMNDLTTITVGLLENILFQTPVAGKVVSVSFGTAIAVTANDTNYATWTLAKRTGAGAAATIATQTTKITAGMGNLAAFVPYAAVTADFTVANTALAAGDVVTLVITKTAAGIALTDGLVNGASTVNRFVTVTVGVEEI